MEIRVSEAGAEKVCSCTYLYCTHFVVVVVFFLFFSLPKPKDDGVQEGRVDDGPNDIRPTGKCVSVFCFYIETVDNGRERFCHLLCIV